MLPFVLKVIHISLYASLSLCCCVATVNIPRNSLVRAVYAFGDSFADSGNNNNRTSVIKANFRPYGKDFMGGVSTGRFSNRKNIADYVVEKLGVKDYLPAYLDPALQDTDLPTGVCFASGGSGLDELTSTLLNVWSLQDQLEFFRDYIVKLKTIVGDEEARQITSNALYLVSWGSNDWAVGYTAVPVRRLQYDVPAYSKLLADKADNFIQELYNLGARRMAFFNTPAIGCFPLVRTIAGGVLRKCSPKFDEEAFTFDNVVISRIQQLNSTLPQARFSVADYYTIVNEIKEHADEYGFTVLDKGCCGSGVVETVVLCNPLSTTCLDDSKYLFWDSVHLTDKGYDIVVDHALLSSKGKLIPPKKIYVSAVFAFGDAYVDQGNNNYIVTLGKSNFPPYGKDFVAGKPTGRFSNGKTLADFFAKALGVKDYLPAYLDPLIQDKDILAGVSFASGGSGYDPLTSSIASAIPLIVQIDKFKQYIEKLKMNTGEEAAKNIIRNSVFLVVASTNDLLYSLPAQRLEYDAISYGNMLVKLALNFVQDIHTLGARRIAVFSAPPVGCLPAVRTLAGGPLRKCVDKDNKAAQLFNNMIKQQLQYLARSFAPSRVAFVDFYNPLISIIENPHQYGLEITDKGCCGTGEIEVVFLCNKLSPTCNNDSEYLFWDSIHLSEKGCSIFVDQVIPYLMKRLF